MLKALVNSAFKLPATADDFGDPAGFRAASHLIFLHGKGSSALKARYMGFEQLGEREHFVTVLPDGLGGEWNVFPPGFRDRSGFFSSGADNTFIKQLLAELVHRGVADPTALSERHLERRCDGVAHGVR